MSDENGSSGVNGGRPRRGSVTTNTLAAIFGRSNSTSGQGAGTPAQPAAANTSGRRMSISTIGLSGTSPIQNQSFNFGGRRASVSTAGSDSIDENAIDDDDGPARSMPTTPFTRRMSFGAQALFNARQGSGSPGTSGRAPSSSNPLPPITDQDQDAGARARTSSVSGAVSQASTQSKPRINSDYATSRSAEGLNWSEQFRSRAESSVSRPSFSSPTNAQKPLAQSSHERAKSISEMPAPPAAMPTPSPVQQSALRRKPDAVGERILRGDFYMD